MNLTFKHSIIDSFVCNGSVMRTNPVIFFGNEPVKRSLSRLEKNLTLPFFLPSCFGNLGCYRCPCIRGRQESLRNLTSFSSVS